METHSEASSSSDPVIANLERRLSELTPHDKPIIVCKDGRLADPADRDRFYETLFASFQRNRNGTLEVRGGRASENGVFVQDQVSRAVVRVCHPVHLVSGQKVILAKKASFQIPTNDHHDIDCEAELWLYRLSPGQRRIIGRQEVTPVDNEVSSKHVTVIRLQDHNEHRVYRVIDGIHPAATNGNVEFPLVDNGASSWIEAPDWHPLQTGRKVKLGQHGALVRIPLWKRNPLSDQGEEYFHQDTRMKMKSHYLSFPLPENVISKIPPSRHPALEYFQHELSDVLELFQEHRVELAHSHLLSTTNLSPLGFKHVIDDTHADFCPTENAAEDTHTIRELFRQLAPKVSPHNEIDLLRIFTGQMVSEDPGMTARLKHRDSKETFLWMISLFECEQWCFSYQNICNSLISRRGALIDRFQNARQIDTALFLEENGCPITDAFLSLHHRNDVIRLLNASKEFAVVQESALDLLQALFELLPGRGVSLTQDDHYFRARQDFPEQIGEEFTSFRAVIERLFSGYYRVKQTQTDASLDLYAPDSGGVWCKLLSEQELTPGTPLRLGRFYEIMLP